jgi:multicomponent Na+:H+ antiporter subunit D
MSDVPLLLVTLLAPLVTALLVGWCGARPNLRETMSFVGGGATFVGACALLAAVADGRRPAVHLAEPLPGIALRLELEPLGALFAVLASFLWIVTTIYSIGYMRGHGERNQTRFFVCFALAIGAVLFAAAAGNLLTLFCGYEALTLATYPLVTHAGTAAARRGGRIYLGILLTSSIGLLLPAIVWTHAVAGDGTFVAGGLLADAAASGRLSSGAAMGLFALFALGIGKAALMPFHLWLPAAMVAPTPVSALLHAVAVVKTGVFAVLKVVVYVFGVDSLRSLGAAEPIAWVAGVTMLFASAVAIGKDNLKARLAWSTIAQLSYIVAGACTAVAAGVVGAGLHMVTHAFGKITLFFGAGALLVGAHVATVRGARGLGRQMPFTFGCFGLAALSIVGLPPFAGVWSKWWLGVGLAESGRTLPLLLLLGSSLLSAAYLLPVVVGAFLGKPAPADDAAPGDHADHSGAHHDAHSPGAHGGAHAHEAPWPCRLAMLITTAACVLGFFLLGPVQRLLQSIVP